MTHHNSIGGHSLKKKKNVNTTQKPKKSLSPHNSPMKKVEQIGLGHTTKSKKSLEVERVIKNIQEGYKVLVLLRGLPGSGKSHLAKTITDVTLGPGDNSHHILSADDYFNQAGRYLYDSKRVSDAHEWNQHRAFQAMSRGLSPVLIDNTNIKMWEMKPYAMMATDYGYLIEILEPDTCWAFNDKELAKKNIHGVPKSTIKEKLEMYDKNITSQKLLVAYNLSYKFQKPPQYRLFPPIIRNNFLNCNLPLRIQHNGLRSTSQIEGGGVPKSKSTPSIFEQRSNVHEAENINLMDFTDNSEVSTKQYAVDVKSENYVNPVDEILMYCENSNTEVLQPKQISDKNILFPDIENAWGIDQKALQSWDIVTPIKSPSPSPNLHLLNIDKNPTETTDGWSNIDGSDFWQEGVDHPPTGSKVLQARSRDINIDSPARILSIPKKTMIDQSSLTDDVMDEESDENRIKDLLDLFPKVSKSSLIELFNRCNKNFNWTVDLLLEDENLEVTSSVDLVEETIEVVDSAEEAMEDAVPIPSESSKNDNVIKRKPLSEDALELKKCLEKKIDINKEHYSDHVLKVKQYKFGGYSEQVAQTSTSAAAASTREFTIDLESDIDSDDSDHVDDDPKNMIELNLGESFVEQLETMFGTDSVFPKGYQPVVQMPRTLARQIYSFYVESVCQQMEAQNHILDRLIKEDEEFARKLQVQDVPLKPPNLLEIMDEQVASKIHKRNVDEWKNMTADNLAAKLTKQKLLKAFPEVEQDSLLEIWHAYDYDYKKTVEDLMASIGPTQMKSSLESIQEPPLSTFTLEEMKEAEGNCLTVEVGIIGYLFFTIFDVFKAES